MLSNRTLLIFEPHPARARLYVARTSGFVARVLLARTIEDLERVHEKDVVLRVVSLSGSDGARTRELASIRRSGSDVATSDHTVGDHRYFSALAGLSCGSPTAGVGFTIYARSTEKLQGTFALRWVWSD
jgi:glutathionyl-hydroquinone reductase